MTSSDDRAGHSTVLLVSAETGFVRQLAGRAGSEPLPFVITVEGDAGTALSRLHAASPAVVVVDVDVLGGRAGAVIRAVLRAAPTARVLSLSAEHDRAT